MSLHIFSVYVSFLRVEFRVNPLTYLEIMPRATESLSNLFLKFWLMQMFYDPLD